MTDHEILDVMTHNREMQAEIAALKQKMRTIANLCNAPHWTADRRWRIRDIAESK